MIRKNVKSLLSATTFVAVTVSTQALSIENSHNINIYSSLRPTLAYTNEESPSGGKESTLDIKDFNSFVGIKGSIDIDEDLTAIFQGEWAVDIPDNSDLGRGRRGYAGLKWKNHRVALGKQRPPQYLLIASYIDTAKNGNSPLSYIQFGPLFVDNMVTYRYEEGDMSILAAVKFDGRAGENKQDFFNTGVGYQLGNFYVAGTFLQNTNPSTIDPDQGGDENTTYALAVSTEFNNLYLAVAYQDNDVDTDRAVDNTNYSGNTLDMVAVYSLGGGYKIRLGAFTFDDGRNQADTNEYTGYSLTFERQLNDSVRIHADYLLRDFTTQENFNAIAVGIRYNFNFSF